MILCLLLIAAASVHAAWDCPEALIRALQAEVEGFPQGRGVEPALAPATVPAAASGAPPVAAIDPRIRRVEEALAALEKGDEGPATSLLHEHGSRIRIVNPEGEIEANRTSLARVDGRLAMRMPQRGDQNEGVFRMGQGAETRAIKILKRGKGLSALLTQWRGALLGEWAGAARVQRVGWAELEDKKGAQKLPFIELEWIFPSEEAVTLKSGSTGRRYFLGPESEQRAAERFASLLARCLALDILPFDPDFLITRGGDVRWLDTGMWRAGIRETTIANAFGEIVRKLDVPGFEVRLFQALRERINNLAMPGREELREATLEALERSTEAPAAWILGI